MEAKISARLLVLIEGLEPIYAIESAEIASWMNLSVALVALEGFVEEPRNGAAGRTALGRLDSLTHARRCRHGRNLRHNCSHEIKTSQRVLRNLEAALASSWVRRGTAYAP